MKLSGQIRQVCGGLGIWIGIIAVLICGVSCFNSRKLQVFVAVLCFQTLLICIASDHMPILHWLYRSLRANLIVQWISTIYITQMLFLLLQIPESEVILRLLITYTCNTASIVYAMGQLPAWKYHVLIRQLYWSTVRSSAILSALLAYLTVMFLQNSMIFHVSETIPEVEASPLPSRSNLNWLFLENSYLIKLLMLFIFQSIAYHAAYVDSGTEQGQQPVMSKRRCG